MNNDIFQERKNKTLDTHRKVALEKRHSKGYRTARENLNALVDADSFIEYGQLAVAAQRNRREIKDLIENTPADGILTGLATVNSQDFPNSNVSLAFEISSKYSPSPIRLDADGQIMSSLFTPSLSKNASRSGKCNGNFSVWPGVEAVDCSTVS